jgi:hypothetical protein
MDAYLRQVNAKAPGAPAGGAYGIDSKVKYPTDKTHKFQVRAADGSIRRFGKQGYWDYELLKIAERDGAIPPGTAEKKRKAYLARARCPGRGTKIKGDWQQDKFSPNNLAIHLLW